MESKLEKPIRQLKANDPSLTLLDLAWRGISDVGMRYLGKALAQNHTLTSLNLGGNSIGVEGAGYLGEALAKNHTLTSLSLADNDIGYMFIWELSVALVQNHTLTSLCLDGNKIGAQQLGKVLAQNHTLTSLSLGANNVDAKGARHLGEALAQNHTLTSLSLGANNIGAKGARHLGEALAQNHSLTYLGLWSNNIGDEGAWHLGETLVQNHSLISLYLLNNKIGEEGARHLARAMLKNHTLLRLNFHYYENTSHQFKKYLEIIKERLFVNAMFYHMMGDLSYLSEKEITHAKRTLNTLGLDTIHLPNEPLLSEMRSFFHTLLTNLSQVSNQKKYTVMILPFSYAEEIDLLRVFFSLDSPEDTLRLSKGGFCFPLIKATDHSVMERPYLCPEWNVLFDPETEVEPDQDWTNPLSYALETLHDTLGFLPRLSFQHSGLTSEDLRDLLAYLATNPPIEYLDLSHNAVMLKNWNKNKTQKMIGRNSVFHCLHQLTKNTLLRELNLSHTQITLDQNDYPNLIPIFNEPRDLAIELSGNYVSSYIRWKDKDTKGKTSEEKTSKALCRFFKKLPPENGESKNDPLKHFFEGLRFVRTLWVEDSFFQAIAVCLNQDADELKESFREALKQADLWQTDLEKGNSIEDYLKHFDFGKWDLFLTLTFMSRFLNAPLIVFSSDKAPVISREKKHLSGNPLFLYWDGEQQYHALAYEDNFDAQDLLNRVIRVTKDRVSVFYDKRHTQSEHLVLQHGFWSERKTMHSVFSVLPKHEGLTLDDHTVRHVALCCNNSATGGHAWLIIEGMHHFGQAFFLCAELRTPDNRTTQINIHTGFCPHRFKKGLLEEKIVARVYPNQPKKRVKDLLERIEKEHKNHYRYSKTGDSSLIRTSQQLEAKFLSQEERKNKTVNCMQWAIERLLEYEIIDQEEATELSGNIFRYWPINIQENKPCCVM